MLAGLDFALTVCAPSSTSQKVLSRQLWQSLIVTSDQRFSLCSSPVLNLFLSSACLADVGELLCMHQHTRTPPSGILTSNAFVVFPHVTPKVSRRANVIRTI